MSQIRPIRVLLGALLATFALTSVWGNPVHGQNLLFVRTNSGSYTTEEQARVTQLQGWGYTVTPIWDNASQASFDVATAAADVAFASSTVDDYQLLYKLRTATCGVVSETHGLDTEFGYATSDGFTESLSAIYVLDNTHEISTGLSLAVNYFSGSTHPRALNGNTLAAGMVVLAQNAAQNMLTLGVIETGGTLANTYLGNSTASGRRVRMPWGSLPWSALNSNGLLVLQQAIAWAASSGELIAHWKLDETSGTTAVDATSYGRDATITGTATWVSGRRVNALDLNKATKGTATGLMGQPVNFTIACWAETRTTDGSGSELVSVGDHFEILSHYTPYDSPVAAFHDGSDYVIVGASGGSRIGAGWHHYAVTFDDSLNELKIYVDGELAGTATTSSSVSYTGLGSNTIIGANGNGDTTFDHDGPIDDIRIYSKALSATEVAGLYDLHGHWRLDEASGTTATDSSPQSRDGTYSGGPALSADGAHPGDVLTAVSFDGSDDLVDLPDMEVDYSAGFSAAFWVKPAATVGSGSSFAFLDLSNGQDVDEIWLGWYDGVGFQLYMTDTDDGSPLHTIEDNTGFVVGEWVHCVATVDAAGYATLYRNGEVTKSGFFTSLPTNVLRTQNSIGDSPWNDPLDGVMDDVRIYNRPLSAAEVSELYGLVGHWKMDEGVGTTAADSTGLANDATLNGATWTTDCAGNSGLEFDGVGDTATTNSAFDPPAAGSVAFWMRSSGPSAVRQRIFGTGGDWEARIETTGTISFDLGDSPYVGNEPFATDEVDTEDRWYHIIAIFDDSDDSYEVYVNGDLQASGISPVNLVEQAAAILTFGNRAGSSEYMEGALRDFRIYNRPLSGPEISELSGLVGYWKLDESSGTVAVDSSTNGNDGVYTNGVTINQTGNIDQAADFDGADDYVGIPDDSTLRMDDVFSLSGWIRADASPNIDRMILNKEGEYEIALSPDHELKWGITNTDPGWSWHGTGHTVAVGKWTHIALTYDNGLVSTYANGVLVDTYAGSGVVGDQYSSLNELRLGGRSNNPAGKYFYGRIDDVHLYKRVLCPVEIYDQYKGGRPAGIRILKWVEVR